jgi:hypothetical protein
MIQQAVGGGFVDLLAEGHRAQTNGRDLQVAAAESDEGKCVHADKFTASRDNRRRATLSNMSPRADPPIAAFASARVQRWVLMLPVVLLHGALAWLLRDSLHHRAERVSDVPRRIELRVLPAPAGAQASRRIQTDPVEPRSARAPRPPARPSAANAVHKPSEADNAAITATLPVPPESQPETAPAPRPVPLDLRLPSTASAPLSPAGRAVADPRANSARRNFGERLAEPLGSDERLVEERRGEGRIRVREGAACVDVREARSAQLDPFSQSTRATPRLAEACR